MLDSTIVRVLGDAWLFIIIVHGGVLWEGTWGFYYMFLIS